MKPLEIERAIERHPKKIDTWRFLGCSAVCEDGDVCLDFYMGTNPWDHESVFMVIRGGNTPESIADAVWNFFQHYKVKRGSPEWNAAWERLESFLLSEFGDDVGQKLCNQYACYYATVPKLKEHVFGLKEATNEQLEAKIGLHVNFCLLNSCLHVPFLED